MSIIDISNLKSGDILLYHGEGWISKAIRKLDGTNYNHAALYKNDSKVIEALSQGVIENDIESSIANSSPVTVLRLNPEQEDMKPVLDVAKRYINVRYAYEQLVLLTIICLFRKIKMNKIVARIVGAVLEKAAALLMNTLGVEGKDSMICSELVYRSYNEADNNNDKYKIRIDRIREKRDGLISGLAEEGSLYDRLFNNAEQIIFSDEKANFMIASNGIVSDKEMEKLVDELDNNYEEETIDLDTERLLKANAEHLFAIIFNKQSEKQSMFNSGINIRNILKALGADGSDFVTPGDLWKAKNTNLQEIGNIK